MSDTYAETDFFTKTSVKHIICEKYWWSALLLIDESEQTAGRGSVAAEDVTHEVIDMDLDDSDFEPGTDRELLGLFFPEVRILQL